jgi:hypothetical protein
MTSTNRTVLVTVKLATLALTAIGMTTIAPSIAQASGTGNYIYNCYGQWWDTAWAQACAWPGATEEGTYRSTADCNNEPDPNLDVWRTYGSTRQFSGPNCSFSARNVTTWWQP